MAGVELEGIAKRYGDAVVVPPLSLRIADGELVVLVGPSGCGKSTLLRIVAGLVEPSAGRVRIGDRDVTALAPGERDIAMVFQSYALYPHMTVFENIAFPLRVRRVERRELERRVGEVCSTLELEALLERLPRDLSGGQRQRVAMGRAIVRQPKVFLFDEPLSNLDAALRAHVRGEIAALHRRLGTTMIYVTHDQHEAMTLADRLVLLRSGVIEQEGPPLLVYERPATRFAAEFLGHPPMGFLPAERRGDAVVCGSFAVALADLGVAPGDCPDQVWLGVRPEHLEVELGSGATAGIAGEVEWLERTGSERLLYVRALGESLVARLPEGAPLETTAGASVVLVPRRARLFARPSGRAVDVAREPRSAGATVASSAARPESP